MSAQHTPGPWAVSQRPTAKDGIEHANGFVAFVAIPRTVCDDREEGESWIDMRTRTEGARLAVADEQRANARLIAAAPDLLAVLREALDFPLITEGSDWWTRVRTAIAKAEGKAS